MSIKMHLQYASYLLRHKWFVLLECWHRGLYWRGIVHDASKFRPSEWIPYARFFYEPKAQPVRDETGYYKPTDTGDAAFDFAWLLHQKRNDHHWQWWMLPEDDGGKDRWRTPPEVLAFVRDVFEGDIQLDPATDDDNPTQAKHWLTRRENALITPWPVNRDVFLNNPFTKMLPFAKAFARQLRGKGVYVGSYSLEAEWARVLLLEHVHARWPWAPTIIIPCPRLRFILPPEAAPDRPQPGGYPTTIWVWSDWTPSDLLRAWHMRVGGNAYCLQRAD